MIFLKVWMNFIDHIALSMLFTELWYSIQSKTLPHLPSHQHSHGWDLNAERLRTESKEPNHKTTHCLNEALRQRNECSLYVLLPLSFNIYFKSFHRTIFNVGNRSVMFQWIRDNNVFGFLMTLLVVINRHWTPNLPIGSPPRQLQCHEIAGS